MRIAPYLHPLWQLAALVLAAWVLTLGLRMRALRRRHDWVPRASLVSRHARAGLAFLGLLVLGYAAGPLTLGLIRGKTVFASGHALFASLTVALLLFGGRLGLRLWRSRARPSDRDLHAFCMGLGLFLALVTMMLGLGLLP